MLPSSSEVVQSFRAVWRSMNEGEHAFVGLDLSARALARSFGAMLLTLPAVVAIIATERLRNGMSNEAGLFEAPWLAGSVVGLLLLLFLVPPAFIVGLYWRVARTARGTGFLIAWNWSGVLVTLILAAPLALYAAGLVKGALALVVFAAFTLIALRLRFAVARSTLGLRSNAAARVVALAFGVEASAVATFAALSA